MVSIAAAAAEWTEPHHWGVTDYPFYENSSMPTMEASSGIGPVLLLVAVVLYVAAVVCILCIFVGS